jgi:mono/diheme cytochrome c family protein
VKGESAGRRASALFLLLAVCACGPARVPQPEVDTARAARLYQTSCAPCHGQRGEGIRGLGPGLAGSLFLRSRSDAEIVRFLVRGRPATDPDNRTGVVMPPRGGNAALSDDDLVTLARWLRTLPED